MSTPITISELVAINREEVKLQEHTEKKIDKKNCRLCMGRQLSMVEFLFCQPKYPLTTTNPLNSRRVADHCKKKLIVNFYNLIPVIAKAKRDKNSHNAHMERFKFESIVTEAIKEEAAARIHGSHFSTLSVEKVLSSKQIESLTNYKGALTAATTHWLKVVDLAGYALSLYYKKASYIKESEKIKRSLAYECAAQDELIQEIRYEAVKTEKEAVKCENAFLAGVRAGAKPSMWKTAAANKRARKIKKVATSAHQGFSCCISDYNITEEEARVISKNIDIH